MTRRSQRRVDYSKYSNDDSDCDSDDDFQLSSSPPVKKTRKSRDAKKDVIKDVKKDAKKDVKNVKEKPIQQDIVKKRNTRTSNVDELFEKDLHEAIEASSTDKHDHADNSFNDIKRERNSRKTKKKNIVHVISDDEDNGDADEDEPRNDTEEDIATMDTLIAESSSVSDSFDQKPNTSLSKVLPVSSSASDISEEDQNDRSLNSPVMESSSKEMKIPTSKQKVASLKSYEKSPGTNNLSRCQKENGFKEAVRTPKITPCSVTSNLSRQTTPGRLRLGLSRNIRVAKPLHPHISPNIRIT